ncbi:MAG: peptidase, partial [Acidobacteria bacterium]|nr:peptidase [Acidobacteriota bacterium]
FEDKGSWSYIGTDCLDIPRDSPTMNFGWLDQGVVLHEFGHAIGLIHEHQNPLGGIRWNRQQVIRDLSGAPNFWDLDTIEHNMFETYDRDQINGTRLDAESVMLYAIPDSWTADDFHSVSNDALSATDKSFIGSEVNYPFPEDVEEVPEVPVTRVQHVEAEITVPGEQDLYTFVVDRAALYTVETGGATDVVLAVFGPDSKTRLVGENDDGGEGHNARFSGRLEPGRYYVQVRHFDRGGGVGAYSLRVLV